MDEQTSRGLQGYMDEFYNPGDPVSLYFEVSEEVDTQMLAMARDIFLKNKLIAEVEYGSTPDSPHVVHISFRKPSRMFRRSLTPLHTLLLDTLRAMGVNSVKRVAVS